MRKFSLSIAAENRYNVLSKTWTSSAVRWQKRLLFRHKIRGILGPKVQNFDHCSKLYLILISSTTKFYPILK